MNSEELENLRPVDFVGLRWQNKRCNVVRYGDDGCQMVFRRLGNRSEGEPWVVRTPLALSYEAMIAMVRCLGHLYGHAIAMAAFAGMDDGPKKGGVE